MLLVVEISSKHLELTHKSKVFWIWIQSRNLSSAKKELERVFTPKGWFIIYGCGFRKRVFHMKPQNFHSPVNLHALNFPFLNFVFILMKCAFASTIEITYHRLCTKVIQSKLRLRTLRNFAKQTWSEAITSQLHCQNDGEKKS